MKILVLGATGFVGRNVAEYFAAKGHEIIGVSHNRECPVIYNTKWLVNFDLCSPDRVQEIFSHVRDIDVLIQCAAATSGCKDTLEDPAMHIPANAVMNSYIFKEATKAGVKHVVFPSCSVMYQSSDTPLKETDFDANTPLNPAYLGFASTKLYCEKLCQFYANISDTKFTAMRNSNFYGAYDKYDPDHSHVFGATVAKVMKSDDKVTVWGSGKEKRDFLHIDNFCSFVEAAINNQKDKYALYNVGSGIALSINDLVQALVNHSGKQLTIEHDVTKPTIPTSLCLDTTKAKEELGWEPSVGLFEGIQKTLAWYRTHVIL